MSKELQHLFKVINEDHIEQLNAALKHDRLLANAKDDKGNSALIVAAEHGNTGIVNSLIKHGAHINYKTPEKLFTPLMAAVQKGNLDTVKYLLENGADKTITDSHGNTALWYAEQNKQQNIIDLLQKI